MIDNTDFSVLRTPEILRTFALRTKVLMLMFVTVKNNRKSTSKLVSLRLLFTDYLSDVRAPHIEIPS